MSTPDSSNLCQLIWVQRAADMLGSVGKFLTVSLKAHFSSIAQTGGGTSGGIICDPSESDSKIYNFTAVSHDGDYLRCTTAIHDRGDCLS